MYKAEIEEKGTAEANHEIITPKNNIDEYIMLALRSFGIQLSDLEKRFGNEWMKKNKKYIQVLSDNNLITAKDNWLKLTKKGYAICDEIISKFA
jgi:oxygen-independent coproporphyrinogen-3 oxidase